MLEGWGFQGSGPWGQGTGLPRGLSAAQGKDSVGGGMTIRRHWGDKDRRGFQLKTLRQGRLGLSRTYVAEPGAVLSWLGVHRQKERSNGWTSIQDYQLCVLPRKDMKKTPAIHCHHSFLNERTFEHNLCPKREKREGTYSKKHMESLNRINTALGKRPCLASFFFFFN